MDRARYTSAFQKPIRTDRIDRYSAGLLFFGCLAVFLLSPVHQLADSKYSMVLTDDLLHHGSFVLDRYDLPRNEPKQAAYALVNGTDYQIELIDGHLYYLWPPGSSILSIPFLAVYNLFGVSAVGDDGLYDRRGEVVIQSGIAAALMATLAVVFYFTARRLLSAAGSVMLTASATLGSQVWSTASRSLWTESWGILLLAVALLLLLDAYLGRAQLRPGTLATLLAWTYFCTPKFWVPIAAITIYIVIRHRISFLRYAMVGAFWALLFFAYSWYHFQQLLPNYYHAYRTFGAPFFLTALSGNLVSPSRGLFIFVPVLLFVAYLCVRYWSTNRLKGLVLLSLPVIAIHLIVVSSTVAWYGGHCYGPRYSTALVPWFFIVALSAVDSWITAGSGGGLRRFELAVCTVLIFLSVVMNGIGGTSRVANYYWNTRPTVIDDDWDKVWDWQHPQFLAPFESERYADPQKN